MTEKKKNVTTLYVRLDTREANMELTLLSRRIRKLKAEAKSLPLSAPCLCPVCSGSGRYVRQDEEQLTDEQRRQIAEWAVSVVRGICHGCGGKGWVR